MQLDGHKILKLPNGVLDHVKKFQSIQKINETVICIVMARTRLDTTGPGLKFCDILECLVESENSKTIQSIRNGMFFYNKVTFLYEYFLTTKHLLLHSTDQEI